MKLEYAKNPQWSSEGNTTIDLVIKWESIEFELPFTASPHDCEAHGREIFAAAAAGHFGAVVDYVAPVTERNQ